MIEDLIIDTTNSCPLKCEYCGTDSNSSNKFLNAEIITSLIAQARENNVSSIFLGGGWFFSHPYWKDILKFNRVVRANIIIDTPPILYILRELETFPIDEYSYKLSISLWGIGSLHDKLSRSKTYRFVPLFINHMLLKGCEVRISFVTTQELIAEPNTVVEFLIQQNAPTSVYFHRLMPVGRATKVQLPSQIAIESFMNLIENEVNSKPNLKIRYHHTLINNCCNAGINRLFVDYLGNVYGCGWIGKINRPIFNITKSPNLIYKMFSGEDRFTHSCPLLSVSKIL